MGVGVLVMGERGVVRLTFSRVKERAVVGTLSTRRSRGTPRPAVKSTRESCTQNNNNNNDNNNNNNK